MPRTKNVPVRNPKGAAANEDEPQQLQLDESVLEVPQPAMDVIDLTLDSPKMTTKPITINLDEDVVIELDDDLDEVAPSRQMTINRRSSLNLRNQQQALSCPVCFENFSSDNSVHAMTTPCGHVFCEDCLKTISSQKKVCPICQRSLKLAKCIRLHI